MTAQATIYTDTLLAELKERKVSAQAQVYRALRVSTVAVSSQLGLPPVDADAMAADLFIDFFYRFVDEIRIPQAIPAYVKIMAVRRTQRLLRRNERVVAEESVEASDDSSATPEEHALRQTSVQLLSECLKHLTPKARTVLKLQYGHDMSFSEAGAHLGVSKQAVGKMALKSVETLRRCIEAKEAAAR